MTGDTLAGKHESLWLATADRQTYPSLEGDIKADVAIVGGGIVGLTAAVLLKDAGMKVALVESRRVMSGVSGHTTAKVTSLHRLIYRHLLDHFGDEPARQYAAANQAAIEKIGSLAQQKGIECDFVRQSAYTYAVSQEEIEPVNQEVAAARSLGLPASFVESIPLPFETHGAVCFENQAQFHPGKYLGGLAALVPGDGSALFEQTRAVEIEGGKPYTLVTAKGKVTASRLIIATHFPVFDKGGFYFARMSISRSYVIAAKIKGEFPPGMYIGVGHEGLSYRRQVVDGRDLVIIGDSAHPAGHGGDTIERYRRLAERARQVFDIDSIEYYWSAQDNMPIDRVPYIGRLARGQDGMFVATGFAKWGMTNGTAAAMILSDLVQDKKNDWAPVFNPDRFKPLTGGAKFVKQNLENIREFVAGAISKPDQDIESLKPGDGMVVAEDSKKLAVYKDDAGKVYRLSPVCTHMGCIVRWNNAERTWDCPCHGSRFNFDGTVIHGPALKDLKKMD